MRWMGGLDAQFFKTFFKSRIHGLVYDRIMVQAERMVTWGE
jgi:mRNA deadenylase 3'-5' endonuclease subunit Ccr4